MVAFFFLAWVTAWVTVVVVVFFFCYDRCLKGLWLRCLGHGWVRCLGHVWVVVGLRLKWVVGRRRSPVFGSGEVGSGVSHGLSLISHRGSASWVWITELGSVDGGFETVDLFIGGWIG